MNSNFDAVIATFGAEAKEKLANVAATGGPIKDMGSYMSRGTFLPACCHINHGSR